MFDLLFCESLSLHSQALRNNLTEIIIMLANCELFLQAIEDFALVMLNAEGLIKSCNKATYAITGFSYNELSDQPFSILYTAEDNTRKRSDQELSETLKTGKFSIESWKSKKDGSKYWSNMSLSPIYSEQQEHVGYAVVIKDITERKQAEVEIREREERYRLMVEGVKDYAIFMLDTEGNILTWNDGAKNIKGYNSDEIIGKHFSTFYTRQDVESGKPERELQIAIKTGKYEEEGWRVRKNGSVFWANVVITALYNEDNQFIGFSKVTRDLSHKRQEEELLRQSEERYRLLVAQVKDYAIFMLDEKGRIMSWNEGAKKIKGYKAEEIIGKYFSIFYPEEDRLNEKPAYELKVARQQGKYEEEGWRLRKDGSRFWANVVITAIYNEKGLFLGYSKVTRDLTERKEAEVAMKESNDKYKLLANQLKETNNSLAHANKELEEFTSIASHDLQEPVRTVKSFLVFIDKKLSNPNCNIEELKIYIQKALKASNRMRELILNLLEYAQLSKEEVYWEEINVNELIGEVLQNLKGAIDTSAATITVNVETENIKGDKIQLMQLVQNLVANSLKFVEDKPEIKIQCRKEMERVIFSVSDNGIGIAKDNQGKIFEIFRREHTAKQYPGTGIGLSICKKIVDRHNGKIWLQSEPGKGTTFYFTLNDNNVVFN
ncbi:MAG: domain S-box protein [Segetibacter sp.]|nr:domain S-box protein [Segetibacter sp.]